MTTLNRESYASLTAAWAAIPSSLTDDYEIVYTAATQDVGYFELPAKTANGYSITIRTASGQEAVLSGFDNARAYIGAGGSNYTAIETVQANLIIDGMQIHTTANNEYWPAAVFGSGTILRNCYIDMSHGRGILNDQGMSIENCVVLQRQEYGYCFYFPGGTNSCYNSVLESPYDLTSQGSGLTLVNNAILGGSLPSGGTYDHNMVSSGSFGTNSNNPSGSDWDNEFNDTANDDYTPLTGGNLPDGIGPSLDANVPTLDFNGVTRSGNTSYIGAAEGASGPSPTNFAGGIGQDQTISGVLTLAGADTNFTGGVEQGQTIAGAMLIKTSFTGGVEQTQGISGSLPVESLIINHESIALFDSIPQTWIDEVKKVLIGLGGESHGRGYLYGLDLLEQDDSKYAQEATWGAGAPPSYTDQYLRVSRSWRNGTSWLEEWGEYNFFTNSAERTNTITGINYMASNYTGPMYFGFGWCWDMTWVNGLTAGKDPIYGCGWAGSSEGGPDGSLAWGLDSGDSAITGNSVSMQTYLDAVDAYRAENEDVKVIFTTGPVDDDSNSYDGEMGWQRYLKHEAIRNHVNTNGGILLDYADILSWDYTAEEYQNPSTWTDGSSNVHNWYDGNTNYVTTADGYDGGQGGCHITADACRQLGRAVWVMLALDLGWDGSAETSYTGGNEQDQDIAGSFLIKSLFTGGLEQGQNISGGFHVIVPFTGGNEQTQAISGELTIVAATTDYEGGTEQGQSLSGTIRITGADTNFTGAVGQGQEIAGDLLIKTSFVGGSVQAQSLSGEITVTDNTIRLAGGISQTQEIAGDMLIKLAFSGSIDQGQAVSGYFREMVIIVPPDVVTCPGEIVTYKEISGELTMLVQITGELV